MFEFLKKSVKVEEIVDIDQKIYEDVYSAQELLLTEANRVLSLKSNYDKEQHTRLSKLVKLGFGSAEQVKEFKTIEDNKEDVKKMKHTIEYFKREYPLNKFIDMDSVKTICEKYGLLLTEASDYIADIPEKNQNEIIQFKVTRKDTREPNEVGSGMRVRFNTYGYYDEDHQAEKIQGQSLLIVAPEHKLNTHGKEREGHILKIKDPIVLQPVGGFLQTQGYLIVSSWGFEASDPLIVNTINN